MLVSAASLTEAASAAAGAAINSTSAIMATASEMAVAVAVNSLGVGSNLWHGVDLYNVSAHRCSGQIFVDSATVFEAWLNSSKARTLLPCVDTWLASSIHASADSIYLYLPGLKTDCEDLAMSGSYGLVSISSMLHHTGSILISFDDINATFSIAWANPVWAGLGYHEQTERAQVLTGLQSVVKNLPASHILVDNESDQFGVSFSTIMFGKCTKWLRIIHMLGWSSFALLGIDNGRGFGTAVICAYIALNFRAEIQAGLIATLRKLSGKVATSPYCPRLIKAHFNAYM